MQTPTGRGILSMFSILCCAYFLVFFQRLSLGVVTASLSQDLQLTPTLMAWLGSAFLYAYAVVQIPAGFLVDAYGPRRPLALLFGIGGGVGGLLFACADSVPLALLGRALIGMGMAVVTAASFKVMSLWFVSRHYARMVSIFMVVGGLGTFFAASPLAILNEFFGWRVVFGSIGGASLLWGFLLWQMVRDAPTPVQAAALGLEQAHSLNEEKGGRPSHIGFFVALRLLLGSRQFLLIILWYMTAASLFFSFAGLWAGAYYTDVHHLNGQQIGGILSLGALSLVLGTPMGAWVSERLHSRRFILIAGSVLAVSGTACLVFFQGPQPLPMLYLSFFAICLAGNGTVSVLFTLVRESIPLALVGTSTALLSCSLFSCTACLQVLLGWILEQGNVTITPQRAYSAAFSVYLVLALISLIAAWHLRDPKTISTPEIL